MRPIAFDLPGRLAIVGLVSAGCVSPPSLDSGTASSSSGEPSQGTTSGTETDASGDERADSSGPEGSTAAADSTGDGGSASDWHDGSFRYLPVVQADIVEFVGQLEFPNEGGYGMVSDEREADFVAFVDAMGTALADGLNAPDSPDWCTVMSLADDAGYALARFHDTTSGRWFIYAADRTPYGQAYFFVNPEPLRDVVLESPHHPFDANTGPQGAWLFRELEARAFLLNKEGRCSDPDPTSCTQGSAVCDGTDRQSDVAHHPRNAFHLLHKWYSDRELDTVFVQLHGFGSDPSVVAEVGDGTDNDFDPDSIATAFGEALRGRGPAPDQVHACQGYVGATPLQMCGAANLQGRYTNEDGIDECSGFASAHSGRFVHLEQSQGLRDEDEVDGWSWVDVFEAIRTTWPTCLSADGSCRARPPQSVPSPCTCGEPC